MIAGLLTFVATTSTVLAILTAGHACFHFLYKHVTEKVRTVGAMSVQLRRRAVDAHRTMWGPPSPVRVTPVACSVGLHELMVRREAGNEDELLSSEALSIWLDRGTDEAGTQRPLRKLHEAAARMQAGARMLLAKRARAKLSATNMARSLVLTPPKAAAGIAAVECGTEEAEESVASSEIFESGARRLRISMYEKNPENGVEDHDEEDSSSDSGRWQPRQPWTPWTPRGLNAEAQSAPGTKPESASAVKAARASEALQAARASAAAAAARASEAMAKAAAAREVHHQLLLAKAVARLSKPKLAAAFAHWRGDWGEAQAEAQAAEQARVEKEVAAQAVAQAKAAKEATAQAAAQAKAEKEAAERRAAEEEAKAARREAKARAAAEEKEREEDEARIMAKREAAAREASEAKRRQEEQEAKERATAERKQREDEVRAKAAKWEAKRKAAEEELEEARRVAEAAKERDAAEKKKRGDKARAKAAEKAAAHKAADAMQREVVAQQELAAASLATSFQSCQEAPSASEEEAETRRAAAPNTTVRSADLVARSALPPVRAPHIPSNSLNVESNGVTPNPGGVVDATLSTLTASPLPPLAPLSPRMASPQQPASPVVEANSPASHRSGLAAVRPPSSHSRPLSAARSSQLSPLFRPPSARIRPLSASVDLQLEGAPSSGVQGAGELPPVAPKTWACRALDMWLHGRGSGQGCKDASNAGGGAAGFGGASNLRPSTAPEPGPSAKEQRPVDTRPPKSIPRRSWMHSPLQGPSASDSPGAESGLQPHAPLGELPPVEHTMAVRSLRGAMHGSREGSSADAHEHRSSASANDASSSFCVHCTEMTEAGDAERPVTR